MEIKPDAIRPEAQSEKITSLTEYQMTCGNVMLAAQNVAVSDRKVADMVMWDFNPVFDKDNLKLTLSTIRALSSSGRKDKDMNGAITSLLNKSEEDLENAYLEGDEETKNKIREIYAQTIDFTSSTDLGPTLKFYLRHVGEDLDQLIPQSIGSKEILLYKGMIYPKENPDDKTNESYFKWAKNIYENSTFITDRIAALRAINNAASIREMPDQYIEKLINAFGIDAKTARAAMRETYTHDLGLRDEFIVRNIMKMEELEKEQPGICKALNEEFGIFDFARYPTQVLIAQFVNKDRNKPYGVMIYPQGDHNGAFSQMEAQIYILWDNLTKLGYSLRIFESSSRGEVLRALISANDRYGKSDKISFALLGGHGTEKNMRFGESEYTIHGELKRTDFLGKKDVENRRAKQLQDIFVEHPSVVLVACSTGAEAGLGESMSKLGAVVTAPEKDSSLGIIKPYKDSDGKIRFDVTYGESPTAVHFNGEKQPTKN